MEGQVIEVQLLENQGGSATIDRINSAVQFAGQAARSVLVDASLCRVYIYYPLYLGVFLQSDGSFVKPESFCKGKSCRMLLQVPF